jgi:hypothetical protein
MQVTQKLPVQQQELLFIWGENSQPTQAIIKQNVLTEQLQDSFVDIYMLPLQKTEQPKRSMKSQLPLKIKQILLIKQQKMD